MSTHSNSPYASRTLGPACALLSALLCCTAAVAGAAEAASVTALDHSAPPLAGAAAARPAQAQPFDPARLAAQHVAGARRIGGGTLRVFGFHVYDGALFAGAQGFRADDVDAAPFLLDFVYARSFSGEAIAARSRKEMDALALATPAQTAVWARVQAHLFPDVREGDHLSAWFDPVRGTTFYYNGALLGNVPGHDFARAFFGIWFDAKTHAPDLRTALLGKTGQP